MTSSSRMSLSYSALSRLGVLASSASACGDSVTSFCTHSRRNFCVFPASLDDLKSFLISTLCVLPTCVTAPPSRTKSKMKPKRSSHCSECSDATAEEGGGGGGVGRDGR